MAEAASSAAATGGAGNVFEQHVDAFWLALLLVRGIPPILLDCTVTEVQTQAGVLGYATDDLLVVATSATQSSHRLLCQVKRSLTVSAADDDFKKTIRGCWTDFHDGERFSADADRLAIVTFRGTNTLLEHFAGLLDVARAAASADDFERRISTPGFVHAKVRQHFAVVREILDEKEGRAVTIAEAWRFLRVLHVISLDLASSTAHTESLIKSMLAQMTEEANPQMAASATWDTLVRESGQAMPAAKLFKRDDLPRELLERHSCVEGGDRRVLADLEDHTQAILTGIRATISGGVHLPRGTLVRSVIDGLSTSRALMVTGSAGSGKSVVAKDAAASLGRDHFVFAFRAEEFAHPTLDATLLHARIETSAAKLAAILAGQDRKVLLIESVERLLEKSTRDAFSDLLALVVKDSSWQILMTCREYSADLVRTAFLEPSGVRDSIVEVPPLVDEELDEIGRQCPDIQRPLANGTLRGLLRNPYVLDMATRISWGGEAPLPQGEREFRARFWSEEIRADQHAGGGMPHRREKAFVTVALRRARALSLFARCDDLDGEAIESLRASSLVEHPAQSKALAAPAHDVLEDWALLHWVDEQYQVHSDSVREFASALGAYPAVRRTYRTWIWELMERDPTATDGLFQSVVSDRELPKQFRDDTLVALLRSKFASEFLERHRDALLKDEKELLWRVIYLLRIACVRPPDWLDIGGAVASLFTVPDGAAWETTLRIVQDDLGSMKEEHRSLLLRFVEDWARGVSWRTPYPDGAVSAAVIAHWLVAQLDGYRDKEQRKQVLQVVSKLPKAAPEEFEGLLRATPDGQRDVVADELQELIFSEMDGLPAARDVPELVIDIGREYFTYQEPSGEQEWYGRSLNIEPTFGIKEARHHEFFPASAYRGPFLHLLRHHSERGIEFVLELLNHSATWYAENRTPSEYIEPPFEVSLRFADGTVVKQWCNGRLWCWYRGLSVGPYALQSILMALEAWLLEQAKSNPDAVDDLLIRVLRGSRSAALTAVVASVATAHARACGETLLVLLSSRECIQLDRARMAGERQSPSAMAHLFPSTGGMNRIYEDERKNSDQLPHRRNDLEMAILEAQLGPLATRLQEELDRHSAALPPVEEQSKEDGIWRLALQRMDLREYSPKEVSIPRQASGEGEPHEERAVLFQPKDVAPDLQPMVNKEQERFRHMQSRLSLQMWGMKCFDREADEAYDPEEWRERLASAREVERHESDPEGVGLGDGGPAFVAAVCVRDHWDELDAEEREWCAAVICDEIERQCDEWNHMARAQRFSMGGDRPAAYSVSALVSKLDPGAIRDRALRALVLALTHAVDEVRAYAAVGVGRHLWAGQRDLVLKCIDLLAAEAAALRKALDANTDRPYREQTPREAVFQEVAGVARQRFEDGSIPKDALAALDVTDWAGAIALSRIAMMLEHAPTEEVSVETFSRVATVIAGWWDEEKGRTERPLEAESALRDILERFLLRVTPEVAVKLSAPIVEAVDSHPRDAQWVMLGLISAEDRWPGTETFWSVWSRFADAVRSASWLSRIDDEYSHGGQMMSAVFLGTQWKDGVRHWKSLEGHVHHVHWLFEDLPPSARVLEDYLRFLFHVGEQSLPQAFVRISTRLHDGNPSQLLTRKNTVFLLESLLRRYVYGRPAELKGARELRESVLDLLDALVDVGSAAAFRMRDDFVTPLKGA